MKYKVLALDLDGTLLSRKKNISSNNLKALIKFIDLGGFVCFVTGRSLTSAKTIADKFEALSNGKKITYIACLNGTLIYDNINNSYVEENTLDVNVANAIFKECKDNHLAFATYTKSGMIDRNMEIYGYRGFTWLINLFNKQTKITTLNSINQDDRIYKINVIRKFSEKKFVFVGNLIKDEFCNELDISYTSTWLYEVTKDGINKGSAIEKISKLLNVSLDEIVAFGDSSNDIPMFKKVGLAIVARDKHKHVLEYANYCVPKPQKTAVARGLEEYVFISNKNK